MNVLAQQTTPFAVNSAATTNATLVKGSPVRLTSLLVSNVNAAARFVKLYDKATAPVVGTDVPLLVIPVAANAALSVELGPLGKQFAAGLGLAITAVGTDADTTAVAAGDVKVAGDYMA